MTDTAPPNVAGDTSISADGTRIAFKSQGQIFLAEFPQDCLPLSVLDKLASQIRRSGSDWQLSVTDNGSGPKEAAGEPPHTGLGTSIVEALAHQLNATVEKSSGAEGTCVTITDQRSIGDCQFRLTASDRSH